MNSQALESALKLSSYVSNESVCREQNRLSPCVDLTFLSDDCFKV